jgi:hypothetical protein
MTNGGGGVMSFDTFGPYQALIEYGWPNPRGLLFGFGCVVVGQIVVFLYYVFRRFGMNSKTIQMYKQKRKKKKNIRKKEISFY